MLFCDRNSAAFIDQARRVGPGPVDFIAAHSGLHLVELQIRHPGAVLVEDEAFVQMLDRLHSTRPELTTEARYEFAQARGHTVDFQHCDAGRSFKVPERDNPNLATVWAYCAGVFWTCRGVTNLPHAFIMQRCRAVSRGEPWRLPL